MDVIIIGAGLTGLSLAYFLRDSGLKVKILEARDRPGGRIHTLYNQHLPPREMGATWLGRKHRHLNALLEEVGLPIFPQQLGDKAFYEPLSTSPPQLVSLPPNDQPSYRIVGGSSRLIHRLLQELPDNQISYNCPVEQIMASEALVPGLAGVAMKAVSGGKLYTAKMIVSTLPPFLLRETIQFTPALPEAMDQRLRKTHTWMGESIKISLSYRTPFWREAELSGTIFSNVGPIPEMYDHADFEDTYFALKGFFNGSYHSLSREERKTMALTQLSKYFGAKAADYLHYDETVWANERFTYHPYPDHVLPHQNNGNPALRQPLFDRRFYLAGSETAPDHPGYMDGAVSSARYVAAQILRND